MNDKRNTTQSNLTDESRQMLIQMGINPDNAPEELFEEPYEEEVIVLEEDVEETVEEKPKFVFEFDLFEEEDEEEFTLNELQKAMQKVLRQNSKKMARARFYISGEDENGLPYGNFNGAGPRAITMYQPDHPEAGKGRNYGKVFYKWGDSRVVALMNAIFEECGWNKEELLEE